MTSQENNVIHPVSVLRQAWEFCRKDLKKLGLIYLIFNLPITVISFLPILSTSVDQKINFAQIIWLVVLFIINSWGHITLLLSAGKVMNAQNYTISQSIGDAKNFLLKYLGLILCVTLFIAGFLMVAGISTAVIMSLLLQVNKILGLLLGSGLIIVAIVALVFFTLRWSLSALTCVYENMRPIAALKQSFVLINKHTNSVVGVYGLILIIYVAWLLPVIILGIFVGLNQNANSLSSVGTAVYTILINIILVPFWTMSTVVLYKKLKEAL